MADSPFLDFGDGADGSASGVSGVVNTYATATATAGSSTVTTSLSVSVGDYVLLIQTQGSGHGTPEVVKVLTAPGGGSFTTTKPIRNSFISGAQAIKIPRYTPGTTGAILAQNWSAAAGTGGVAVVMCNGKITIGGNCNNAGTAGSVVTTDNTGGATGKGFKGGNVGYRNDGHPYTGRQGDSYNGAGTQSTSANGNAGGGGSSTPGNANGFPASGGGAGHSTSGSNGSGAPNTTPGTGGGTASDPSNFLWDLGAGGGGAGGDTNLITSVGGGACGGGIFIVIAPEIVIDTAGGGSITVSGAQGGNGHVQADGGSSCAGVVVCMASNSINLGTNGALAVGGAANDNGGAGKDGYVICYGPSSTIVSGSSNPTYTFVEDNTLLATGFGDIF